MSGVLEMASVNYSVPVINTTYVASVEFDMRAMGPVYNNTEAVINAIAHKEAYPEGMIAVGDGHIEVMMTVREDWKPLLGHYAGPLGVMVCAALLVCALPLAGVFWCCCYWWRSKRRRPFDRKYDACIKALLAILLIGLLTLFLFGVVVAFATDSQVESGAAEAPGAVLAGIKDARSFLNATQAHARWLLVTNYRELDRRLTALLHSSGLTISLQLGEFSRAVSVTTLHAMVGALDGVQADLRGVRAHTAQLRTSAERLNEVLRSVKGQLLRTLATCDRPACKRLQEKHKIGQLDTEIHYSQMPDVSELLNNVTSLLESNIKAEVAEGQAVFRNIQREIQRSVDEHIPSVQEALTETGQKLEHVADEITWLAGNASAKLQEQTVVADTMQQMHAQYGPYRRYVGGAAAAALLAVSSMLLYSATLQEQTVVADTMQQMHAQYGPYRRYVGGAAAAALLAVSSMLLYSATLQEQTVVADTMQQMHAQYGPYRRYVGGAAAAALLAVSSMLLYSATLQEQTVVADTMQQMHAQYGPYRRYVGGAAAAALLAVSSMLLYSATLQEQTVVADTMQQMHAQYGPYRRYVGGAAAAALLAVSSMLLYSATLQEQTVVADTMQQIHAQYGPYRRYVGGAAAAALLAVSSMLLYSATLQEQTVVADTMQQMHAQYGPYRRYVGGAAAAALLAVSSMLLYSATLQEQTVVADTMQQMHAQYGPYRRYVGGAAAAALLAVSSMLLYSATLQEQTVVADTMQQMHAQYGPYRRYVGGAAAAALLAVNCCNKGAGSKCLLCGMALIFIVGGVIALVMLIYFAVGVAAQRVICDPLTEPRGNRLFADVERFVELEKALFNEKRDPDFNLTSVIIQCHQNFTVYKTFQLHRLYDLDELRMRMSGELERRVTSLRARYRPPGRLTILKPSAKAKLRQLAETGLSDFDFDKILHALETNITSLALDDLAQQLDQTATTLQGRPGFAEVAFSLRNASQRLQYAQLETNITSLALDELAQQLDQTATTLQGRPGFTEVAFSLRNASQRLQYAQTDIVTSLLSNASALNDTATRLRDALRFNHSSLKEAISYLMHETSQAETFLNTQGADIIQNMTQEFASVIAGLVNAYLDHVVLAAQTEVGRCGPLSHAFNATRDAHCHKILMPTNGYWMALSWCILLFVPLLVVSQRLAKLYLHLDPYPGPLVEAEYLYDAYADRDNVPLANAYKAEKRSGRGAGGRGGAGAGPSGGGGAGSAGAARAAAALPPLPEPHVARRYNDMAPKHWEEGPPRYHGPTEYERPPPYYYPGPADRQ
ncbi:prominin domain-containing protein [Phthorimaea operculella]|nr:prominin domain-containing protein [Phthorimaea operculella]